MDLNPDLCTAGPVFYQLSYHANLALCTGIAEVRVGIAFMTELSKAFLSTAVKNSDGQRRSFQSTIIILIDEINIFNVYYINGSDL